MTVKKYNLRQFYTGAFGDPIKLSIRMLTEQVKRWYIDLYRHNKLLWSYRGVYFIEAFINRKYKS